MSFQVPQHLLACCQPHQCLDPSQFMAFLVLPCPSRSPSSCWLAVNLISVWILLSLWPSLSFHVLPGPPAPAGLLSTSVVSFQVPQLQRTDTAVFDLNVVVWCECEYRTSGVGTIKLQIAMCEL